MSKIGWYANRLKAMSAGEVLWRVEQKMLQWREGRTYGKRPAPVTDIRPKHKALRISGDAMALNYGNAVYSLNTAIPLLGDYDYGKYKKDWHAGFNTPNRWALTPSYAIDYKQRDDTGDARTNWELNRHYQFALLAKDYYASGKKEYLDELTDLFHDWNKNNPFLWGISWTSAMEIAIRVSNWCYAYCFLDKAKDVPPSLLDAFSNGILNMTSYLTDHYSRYSSANNHLIVEMYAIGMVGILTGHKAWTDLAVSILTREFPLQNYGDGINKELALHYQSFYMEAVGSLMRLMLKNGLPVPPVWVTYLSKMSEYLSNCVCADGEAIEFGDNDEGKILNLQGVPADMQWKPFDHYGYVLRLMSYVLPMRYVDAQSLYENCDWLFTDEDGDRMMKKPLYAPTGSVCYKEGGNSILRSRDGRAAVGIDHAALGFGTIAAHGHSDALSFVMVVDGMHFFADPGTYVYHCDIESRNAFRRTRWHNTVCVEGADQSEMLGAFLWGRKAKCKLISCDLSGDRQTLEAEHDGYAPVIHRRRFTLEGSRLVIFDSLSENVTAEATLMLDPFVRIKEHDEKSATLVCEGTELKVSVEGGSLSVAEADFSPKYGIKVRTKALKIEIVNKELQTFVSW